MTPRRKGELSVGRAIWRLASVSTAEDWPAAGSVSVSVVKDWPSADSVVRVDAVATDAPRLWTKRRRSIISIGINEWFLLWREFLYRGCPSSLLECRMDGKKIV